MSLPGDFGPSQFDYEFDKSDGGHDTSDFQGIGFFASDFTDSGDTAYSGTDATGFSIEDGNVNSLDPAVIGTGAIPEPASLALLGLGALTLLGRPREARAR